MIRNDFVSNSSSSSFMIGFKDHETAYKYRDMIANEWGGKIADLIQKWFDKDKELKNDEYDFTKDEKKFDVWFSGIFESTEDSMDYLIPGKLVYDTCYPCSYGIGDPEDCIIKD